MRSWLKHAGLATAAALALVSLAASSAAAAVPYKTLGQPGIGKGTLNSRCPDANARFNFRNKGGFDMFGPAGIAIDPRGRIFVTDYGGRRVLTWPNFEALQSCSKADGVIGVGDLSGPEAVAVDPENGTVFVADTLSHTVKGYRFKGGVWVKLFTLGVQGVDGDDETHFNFPRGLAVDPKGRLFVADDDNNRVEIFDGPFSNGKAASDSIGAGLNGGFSAPKAVAMVGNTLFVADYNNSRVLRFTGPFLTPQSTYIATGIFSGVTSPVDLAVHPDGSLLVTDQATRKIYRYADAAFTIAHAPTTSFGDNMGPEPLGVAADRDGRIYIADYRRFRVLIRQELVKGNPVTAGATAATKVMLSVFHARADRATDRVAIGQQLITYLYGKKSDPKAWNGDWLQLQLGHYPLPRIMAGELSDLESYPGFSPNSDALKALIQHGQAGNIVSLVWHPDNPNFAGDFSTPTLTVFLQDMVNRNTDIGQAWQLQLDRAAAVLKQFAKAGVTVVFRPLHEQNGTFFWWGHDGSTGADLRLRQQAWTAMWRDMVTEFTVRDGLKNLIFVFGTNQLDYAEVAPVMTYYPGAAWVDMVSIDVYQEQLNMAGKSRGIRAYTQLIDTGKPFGLAEFGQDTGDDGTGTDGQKWDARTLAKRVRDSYQRTAFAIAWYSSKEAGVTTLYALPDVAFGRELLNDPLIDTQ